MTRVGLVMISGLLVACGFPGETWAGDEPSKPRLRTDFSQRESESRELQDFRGGCCTPDAVTIVIAILLSPVILPAFGLYKLGDWLVSLFRVEKPCAPRRSPEPDRERRGVPSPGVAPIPGEVQP